MIFIFSLSFVSLARAETSLPTQIPLENPKYISFFEKASQAVGTNTSECARFVNRIFGARFGFFPFGNAWTMQTAPENQKALTLLWQLGKDQYNPQTLQLNDSKDRVRHFEKLYSVLAKGKYPIGVLGFMYQFSFYQEEILSHPQFLPQSHVVFLAGKKSFVIENETDGILTVEQILTEKWGVIHDFERSFVLKYVPLEQELLPKGKIKYEDYLVEEHFKSPMRGSLLELFLRKHRNNHITPLLRPVSFSRISDELVYAIEQQERKLVMEREGF